MYAIQRAHRTCAAWVPEAEQALANLKLLPANLDACTLPRNETLALKRRHERNIAIAKNDAMIVIPEFSKLLATVAAMLNTATPDDTFPRLILLLLLVSGHRCVELVNGRSTFAPAPSENYMVFSG